MMKKIFISLMFVGLAAISVAKPVDYKRAASVAEKASLLLFMEHHPEYQGQKVMPYRVMDGRKIELENVYYFDLHFIADDEVVSDGFIVVSGDDIAAPVLAFSFESGYINQLNPAAKDMLRQYDQQIAAAKGKGVQATPEIAAKWAMIEGIESWEQVDGLTAKGDIYDDNIPQLLGNMRWGQGNPYNRKCPGGSVTGCVATAFGMIMNYWNYPVHGFGSHSYNGADNPAAYPDWTYGELSADFEHTYYDWDHIEDYAVINSSDSVIEAVSTLLFHLGVALDMHYTPNGSGCWSLPEYAIFDTSLHLSPNIGADTRIPRHFGYKYSYSGMRDSVHSDSLWLQMLYTSLSEGKPIYYAGWAAENNEAGHSGTSGHGYIIDGYFSDVTDSNYFHINWGWSGSSDGYFKLDAMKPSNSDFTKWHGAIIGLEPDTTYQGYDPAVIRPVVTATAKVYAHDGAVVVRGCEGEQVTVYDLMGRRAAMRQATAGSMWSAHLRPGVYVVKVGQQQGQKIIIL